MLRPQSGERIKVLSAARGPDGILSSGNGLAGGARAARSDSVLQGEWSQPGVKAAARCGLTAPDECSTQQIVHALLLLGECHYNQTHPADDQDELDLLNE